MSPFLPHFQTRARNDPPSPAREEGPADGRARAEWARDWVEWTRAGSWDWRGQKESRAGIGWMGGAEALKGVRWQHQASV